MNNIDSNVQRRDFIFGLAVLTAAAAVRGPNLLADVVNPTPNADSNIVALLRTHVAAQNASSDWMASNRAIAGFIAAADKKKLDTVAVSGLSTGMVEALIKAECQIGESVAVNSLAVINIASEYRDLAVLTGATRFGVSELIETTLVNRELKDLIKTTKGIEQFVRGFSDKESVDTLYDAAAPEVKRVRDTISGLSAIGASIQLKDGAFSTADALQAANLILPDLFQDGKVRQAISTSLQLSDRIRTSGDLFKGGIQASEAATIAQLAVGAIGGGNSNLNTAISIGCSLAMMSAMGPLSATSALSLLGSFKGGGGGGGGSDAAIQSALKDIVGRLQRIEKNQVEILKLLDDLKKGLQVTEQKILQAIALTQHELRAGLNLLISKDRDQTSFKTFRTAVLELKNGAKGSPRLNAQQLKPLLSTVVDQVTLYGCTDAAIYFVHRTEPFQSDARRLLMQSEPAQDDPGLALCTTIDRFVTVGSFFPTNSGIPTQAVIQGDPTVLRPPSPGRWGDAVHALSDCVLTYRRIGKLDAVLKNKIRTSVSNLRLSGNLTRDVYRGLTNARFASRCHEDGLLAYFAEGSSSLSWVKSFFRKGWDAAPANPVVPIEWNPDYRAHIRLARNGKFINSYRLGPKEFVSFSTDIYDIAVRTYPELGGAPILHVSTPGEAVRRFPVPNVAESNPTYNINYNDPNFFQHFECAHLNFSPGIPNDPLFSSLIVGTDFIRGFHHQIGAVFESGPYNGSTDSPGSSAKLIEYVMRTYMEVQKRRFVKFATDGYTEMLTEAPLANQSEFFDYSRNAMYANLSLSVALWTVGNCSHDVFPYPYGHVGDRLFNFHEILPRVVHIVNNLQVIPTPASTKRWDYCFGLPNANGIEPFPGSKIPEIAHLLMYRVMNGEKQISEYFPEAYTQASVIPIELGLAKLGTVERILDA